MFSVLPPEKASAFLGVHRPGLYMGSSFAPNHVGMPLVSSQLKLDFLRRQVLDEPQYQRRTADLGIHGG